MAERPDIPLYVTRAKADGERGYLSLSPWVALTTFLLIVANIFGWSIFGLVVLAEKVVSLLG